MVSVLRSAQVQRNTVNGGTMGPDSVINGISRPLTVGDERHRIARNESLHCAGPDLPSNSKK